MLKESGFKQGSAYEFDVDYLADESTVESVSGVQLVANSLESCSDQSVALVLLSGLTDAWLVLHDHRDLFKQKVSRVVIMGGVEVEGEKGQEIVKRDERGFMIPDKAQNNTFDFDAAQKLYRTLQEEGVPMTVVTRWAAYAAKSRRAAGGPAARGCVR